VVGVRSPRERTALAVSTRRRARWTLRRADLCTWTRRVLAEAASRWGRPRIGCGTRAWASTWTRSRRASPWSRAARARRGLRDPLDAAARAPVRPGDRSSARSGSSRDGRSVPGHARGSRDPSAAARGACCASRGCGDCSFRFAGWVEARAAHRALPCARRLRVALALDSTSQSLLEALAAGMIPIVT
jgi:hypothetical protein